MEKLELKHLAPYLPYGFLYGIYEDEKVIIRGMTYNSDYLDIEFEINAHNKVSSSCLFEEIKPILRPFSDLTKEMEFNGEEFVPILELSRDYLPPNYRDWIEVKSTDKCNYYEVGCVNDKIKSFYRFNKNPKDLPYRIVQKLFKWHFDVFGLIEKGLAISIHDVKIAAKN